MLAWVAADALASADVGADHCIVGQSVFGCRSERDIEQIISYHDDVDALRMAVAMSFASGNCNAFADGERVLVVGHSQQPDLTAVRRPSETEAFWIAGSWSRPASDCSDSASRSIYTKLGLPDPVDARAPIVGRAAPLTSPSPLASSCVYKPVMTDAEIARCRARRR